MREHDRVVVRVDDPRVRGDLLNHLMQVRPGGNTRTDIEELPYPLGSQVRHRAAHEVTVGPDLADDGRPDGDDGLGCAAIGRVIVLAAEPVVIDASRVSEAGVEREPLALPVFRIKSGSVVYPVTRHDEPSFLARKAPLRPKPNAPASPNGARCSQSVRWLIAANRPRPWLRSRAGNDQVRGARPGDGRAGRPAGDGRPCGETPLPHPAPENRQPPEPLGPSPADRRPAGSRAMVAATSGL